MTLSFVIIVMCHEKCTKNCSDKWLRIEKKSIWITEKSDLRVGKKLLMMAIEGVAVMPEMRY